MKAPIQASARKSLDAGRVNNTGSAEELQAQVERGLSGLRSRVAASRSSSGMRREKACVYGARLFVPEYGSSFDYNATQYLSANGLLPVNYVVRSGMDYSIPISVGIGEGYKFFAHGIRFVIRQRMFVARSGVNAVAWMDVSLPVCNAVENGPYQMTQKVSCYPVTMSAYGVSPPFLNFRWNLLDGASQTLYSDGYLPGTLNQQRSYTIVVQEDAAPYRDVDGGWHKFSAPKLIGPQNPMTAIFRPITDIVQLDSSVSLVTSGSPSALGCTYDDRESGRRNQSVNVQVELQGEIVYQDGAA